jgi:hypothetical protein
VLSYWPRLAAVIPAAGLRTVCVMRPSIKDANEGLWLGEPGLTREAKMNYVDRRYFANSAAAGALAGSIMNAPGLRTIQAQAQDAPPRPSTWSK